MVLCFECLGFVCCGVLGQRKESNDTTNLKATWISHPWVFNGGRTGISI